MKHKLLRYSSIIATLTFLVVFYGLAFKNTPESKAVKATDFKAGRIVDDGVFYNADSMTVDQIQSFMDRVLPSCDMWGTGKMGSGYYINGRAVDPNTTRKEYARRMREEVGDKRYHAPPYVCINKYYENPQTHVSNFDTNGNVQNGMLSAAQIIYNAAKEYNINPQVLLVMLKKESYAWGDDWPTKNEYNTVMGYACPDNAACDTKYYGFYNQVNMAAWQLDYYKKHIYSYNYRPYATNNIYYSPTYSCGSKKVYIENYATASLYIYTPYTPNDAALRNYPGTASCGSYGNRNFFMYFSEWFGSTLFNATEATVEGGDYYINSSKDPSHSISVASSSFDYSLSLNKKTDEVSAFVYAIQKNSDGSYSIVNTATNTAFDTETAPQEGVAIKMATYNSASATQKWVIYDSGNSVSFAPFNNKTVALSYNESEKKFVLTSYTKADSQKYALEKYVAPASQPEQNSTTNPDTTEPADGSSSTNTPDTQGGTNSTPAVEEFTPTLQDGTYAIIPAINNMSAITLLSTNTYDYMPLQFEFNGNRTSQRFEFKFDKTTGYYTIRNPLINKYVWAEPNDNSNGVVLKMLHQRDGCGEKWKIDKNTDGTFAISSSCTDKLVVTVGAGQYVTGARAQLLRKDGSKAQKFTFTRYYDDALDGQYVIRSSTNTNYVMDIYYGVYRDRNNVQLYKNNWTKAQSFTIKYFQNCGCYVIRSSDSKYVLDVSGNGSANGTNVQIYSDNGTNAQRWYISQDLDGYYKIRGVGSGKLLDLSGNNARDWSNIGIWQDNNTSAQRWKLDKIK